MDQNVSLQLQFPLCVSNLNLDNIKRNEKVFTSPLIHALQGAVHAHLSPVTEGQQVI